MLRRPTLKALWDCEAIWLKPSASPCWLDLSVCGSMGSGERSKMKEGRTMITEAELGKGKTYCTAVSTVDGRKAERVGERGFSEAEGGWERKGKSVRDQKKAGKRVRGAWKWTRERGEE